MTAPISSHSAQNAPSAEPIPVVAQTLVTTLVEFVKANKLGRDSQHPMDRNASMSFALLARAIRIVLRAPTKENVGYLFDQVKANPEDAFNERWALIGIGAHPDAAVVISTVLATVQAYTTNSQRNLPKMEKVVKLIKNQKFMTMLDTVAREKWKAK